MNMETLTLERKRTATGSTYFNGEGAYQKEMDEMWERLVPMSGMASTLNGELVRAVSRLNYEFFTNGNLNACEQHFHDEEEVCCCCHGTGSIEDEDEDGNPTEVDCPECGGSGYFVEEVEDECTLSAMFGNFLLLIEECVPEAEAEVEMVRDIILSNLYASRNQFCERNETAYNDLMDAVAFHVLTTPDGEIPERYVEEMEE